MSIQPDKILDDAAAALRQRGADYDGKGYQGGERSMEQTVAIFKAFTGIELSELDGWRFLICLKMARSTTGKPKLDTYVDLSAYSALAGECHLETRVMPIMVCARCRSPDHHVQDCEEA